MNHKLLLLGAVALSAGLLAGCPNDQPAASALPASQSLNTAQVLALARRSSETTAPFPVNDGALTLNDTRETSVPIAVNTM